MARINNLTNFLTDVATAIKTKTGDSTAIPASQFDTKIANITTGHLDNTEYTEANDDLDDILEGSTPITIYPPDWSEIGYSNAPQNILDDFTYSKNIYNNWDSSSTSFSFVNNTDIIYMPLVDTSNVTSMNSTFRGCSNLSFVDSLNTSNVTTMSQTFQDCKLIKRIPLFNTEKVTTMYQLFSGCTNLKNVPQFDTKALNAYGSFTNMFKSCTKLTEDSLNNIMAMCKNATNYPGPKTLSYIGLTSAQATICQGLSNYQAFTNAGWTTGY